MSQPVHGYLRFCFELSACAHRNVGAGTQLTGNATYRALTLTARALADAFRYSILQNHMSSGLVFIKDQLWKLPGVILLLFVLTVSSCGGGSSSMPPSPPSLPNTPTSPSTTLPPLT